MIGREIQDDFDSTGSGLGDQRVKILYGGEDWIN
jgi:hypothetical protein